jgi:hypothetical protein
MEDSTEGLEKPSEPIKDFVKKKIRVSKPKKRGVGSRPRASGHAILKKAAEKLAKLLDNVPDEYLDRALRRLGEQLDATKPIWDVNKKKMIEIPDEKIRQDAALVILAYKWGKPVERTISATAKFEDLAELQKRLESSPAFQEFMSSQKTVER